ncbi:YeeE/YedE thiosulfate transporter family protein [Halonatronum saccharophilum]|uniref:YeeE/YedE thiosulfate transporter family protein n=1 Tax=Halonatronum saccharophilum TaxID=150060 RepID=UPI0004B75774|nr:YeeE/YedE thiosulfate transporter family protein [Halonatronum saccharophilum]
MKLSTKKSVLTSRWSYWVGALLLALLNISILFFTEDFWGITESFILLNFSFSKGLVLNLGVILGSFISIYLVGGFRLRGISKGKRSIYIFCGGILMGYGARIAGGCNIGAMVNGTSSLSMHGWFFLISTFLGVKIGTILIKKFIY